MSSIEIVSRLCDLPQHADLDRERIGGGRRGEQASAHCAAPARPCEESRDAPQFGRASGGSEHAIAWVWPASCALRRGAPAPRPSKPTQFWNLTSQTVTSLGFRTPAPAHMATISRSATPTASSTTSALKIVGLPSGRYDLELRFKGGRVCFVRHVEIVTGKVFSVEDKALTACSKT